VIGFYLQGSGIGIEKIKFSIIDNVDAPFSSGMHNK
jgi:hypothetical protein